MPISRTLATFAVALITATAALADAPARVVSVNLCTDQLALMLAAPGQLVSVSRLAHDPGSSVMVEAAKALPTNGSRAEEVYLLQPDLVLAGTFTDPATVQMLRKLGIKVALFAPATALSDVPDRLAQMGAALGRQQAATRLTADFDAALAGLDDAQTARPRAAIYYANGYSSGGRTLAGDILRAAGFDNVADDAGLDHGGTLPLEQLVLLAPDLIVTGRDYPGQARAEDVLAHPALRALPDTAMAGQLTDQDWICGTPAVLDAVREMRALRLRLEHAG
ncbi:ABC transporter substrate-binding protein [Pontibaca salina]|uniref:ABC transporter substrate-binding protein n=1 Tax=Pontibaca salina TaxID=2795731 RepID=UPI002FCDC172